MYHLRKGQNTTKRRLLGHTHTCNFLTGSLKTIAPGEARTHGLQIMRLTRCLLRYGGYVFIQTTLPIHSKVHQKFQSQKFYTHGGTRTPNLRFRRPTPYPLGHAGMGTKAQRNLVGQTHWNILAPILTDSNKLLGNILVEVMHSPASSVGRAWDS